MKFKPTTQLGPKEAMSALVLALVSHVTASAVTKINSERNSPTVSGVPTSKRLIGELTANELVKGE